MTRMVDLIADTRRLAYGSMADQLNFLATEALVGAAELEFVMDVSSITPGMVLSSGLNVYYVIGVDANTKKVSVYPAYDNSRNDALPVGSPVMIRPRVTDWQLFNDVNNAISQMSSPSYGLYRVGTWTTNTDTLWDTVTVPTTIDLVAVLGIRVRQLWTPDVWYTLPSRWWRYTPENRIIRFLYNVPVTTEIDVVYKAPFVKAQSLTDDAVVDLGLAETMLDIPPLGAAIALLRQTENRRGQIHSQSDPRRADEVPGTQNSGAATDMRRQFRQRIDDEYARLIQRDPLYLGV